MKGAVLKGKFIAAMLLGTLFLAGCGDDDSFAPVSKDRGYDYAYTSAKDLSKTPCNEMREGREAVIGREKESYYCQFDKRDSVYIWAGYNDTLTANGKEFIRKDASSSSRGSSSSEDEDASSSSRYSSSYSSSSYSSSSYSSSSYRSSSSSVRSSSSVEWNPAKYHLTEKGEQFNPNIEYGTMTDPRDGKTYRTVEILGQIWMAENLNYAEPEVGLSYCYNSDEKNCELYGRLYSRDATMNSSKCNHQSYCDLGSGPIQGVCPDGWHIPTYSEMQELVDLVDSTASPLISTAGWGVEDSLVIEPGTDTYGLSFVGSGAFDARSDYNDLGNVAYIWVYKPSIYDYYLLLKPQYNKAYIYSFDNYPLYLSVRCVKGDGVEPSSSSSSVDWEKLKPRLTEKGEQFNPDIEYGTMTDPRDGKTYRTVEVEGVTWMAENLNYTGHEIGKSYCFNDDEEMCELYGRFYSRDAAMNSSKCVFGASCLLGNDTLQGICPDGWHIPTYSETQALETLANKKAQPLMSTIGWGTEDSLYISPGVDTYGLSFVGTGEYSTKDSFNDIGEYAFIWVYYQSPDMYYLLIRGKDNEAFIKSFDGYESNFSVRCVKD